MSRGLVILTIGLTLTVAAALAAPPAAGVRRPTTRSAASPVDGDSTAGPEHVQAIAHLPDCLVYLSEDIQVPALEAGPLVKLEIKEGDVVQKGQVLGQLDDSQPLLQKQSAELERNAAIAKASDDIETRFAQATLAYSNAELQRLLSVEKRSAGSVTVQEIEKARLAKHRDELQIERSKLDMKVARMTAEKHQAEVQAAELAVGRRQILAPIDGEVATVFHEQSEWVNAGEPVCQVVRMDRLRVEGFVGTSELNVDEISGRQVLVEVELARGRRERFAGRVTHISPLVTAGGKYRVRAEVENRLANDEWLLRPGITVGMSILK